MSQVNPRCFPALRASCIFQVPMSTVYLAAGADTNGQYFYGIYYGEDDAQLELL